MNHYRFLFLFSIAACLFISTSAFAIDGFPGSTWGELRWELPKDGHEDLILYGWVKQGVDLVKWADSHLDAYLTVRYRWDTEQLDWNNTIGPGVGISYDTTVSKFGFMTFGVEFIADRFYKSNRTENKAVIYMNWYGWWDLKRKP